jgi:hypothetical protein
MGCDETAHIPGICVPLVSGLFTVLQKLIQLLLEVWLCTAFERLSRHEDQEGEGETHCEPCPGLVTLPCPSSSNPVDSTAGSKQREVCDGST